MFKIKRVFMGFIKEFKEFAVKGNVVDLAVAVVIGGAFGKIVTSVVNDLIMPLVGYLTGGSSFTEKFWVLEQGSETPGPYASLADAQAAGANVLAYGSFMQTVVDFLIVSLSIFMAIRAIQSLKRKEQEAPAAPEAPPPPSSTDALLMEIRDELKRRNP